MPSQPLAVDFGASVEQGLNTFADFVPRFLGFLVILIVGYFIAKIIAKILNKVLEKVGFDEAVEKGPVKKAMAKSQYDVSDIVSKIVFFVIFIPFLSAAVGTLGIAALEQPLADFITLLPKILVAVILIVVGGVVAGAVKKLVESSLGGLSYGTFLADAVGILVLLGFVKAALDQVGIATNVTGPVLIALLATVAGILIVGVGGGLIKPMQGRLEDALSKASAESKNVKDKASKPSASDAKPSGSTGRSDTSGTSASSERR